MTDTQKPDAPVCDCGHEQFNGLHHPHCSTVSQDALMRLVDDSLRDRTADIEKRLADAYKAIRWLVVPPDAWLSGLSVEEIRAMAAQASEQVALARAATKVTP